MPHHALTRRRLLAGLVAEAAPGLPLATNRQSAAAPQEPETLFQVTFPRGWQPKDEAQGAFYRIILEPGQTLTYLPGPYCGCSGETIREGTAAERVMSGTYAIELDRPFTVRRTNGNDEDIDPDTEVQLTEGDVAIYRDALAFGALGNAGDETITLFGASITSLDYDEGTFTPPLPEEMSARLSVATWDAWRMLGDGDIIAALTRRTLAAGEALSPYDIAGLEAIHVESGELHAAVIRAGESRPTADPRYIGAGATLGFRQHTPGTKRLLANPFAEPATLLTLTFTSGH